jgi:hypothetical protein
MKFEFIGVLFLDVGELDSVRSSGTYLKVRCIPRFVVAGPAYIF